MAPRKRTAKQEQKKKLELFLTDFDKQCETRRQEIERFGKNLVKQVENFYVQEICKLPRATRQMQADAFLAQNGQDMTAKLAQIEEEIKQAIQIPIIGKKPVAGPATATRSVVSKTPAYLMATPAPPPPSNVAKQLLSTATLCRKALPNEMLWSSQGSPVVVDPRAVHAQNKIKATIEVKTGTIALTESPLSEDMEQCPRLEANDLEAISKLQKKLSKIVEINKGRANGDKPSQPTSRSK